MKSPQVRAERGRRSFLKWAGGKTRVASLLSSLGPPQGYGKYVEPFCGSAAVFFSLLPDRALISDWNEDLVACLRAVRDDPNAVMAQLDRIPNTRARFNRVRSQNPRGLGEVERAARLIYLNKTAFRGLWRVNKQGQFNTPYGQYRRPYYNRGTLLAASEALRSADIRCADFEDVLREADRGDWVYLDPPYVPDRKWGDFTRYTPGQFGPSDQERLARFVEKLDDQGVCWLMTNSDTPVVRELYRGYRMAQLSTRRDITLQASARNSTDLVISNYVYEPHELLAPLRTRRRG